MPGIDPASSEIIDCVDESNSSESSTSTVGSCGPHRRHADAASFVACNVLRCMLYSARLAGAKPLVDGSMGGDGHMDGGYLMDTIPMLLTHSLQP
jgi:hypothetical protein